MVEVDPATPAVGAAGEVPRRTIPHCSVGRWKLSPPHDLIERWRALLPGFDATQHLTGPVVVTARDEHKAACGTTVRAYHHLVDGGQEQTWTVAGKYHFEVVQDSPDRVIAAITLAEPYEEGDRVLLERGSRASPVEVWGRVSSVRLADLSERGIPR